MYKKINEKKGKDTKSNVFGRTTSTTITAFGYVLTYICFCKVDVRSCRLFFVMLLLVQSERDGLREESA